MKHTEDTKMPFSSGCSKIGQIDVRELIWWIIRIYESSNKVLQIFEQLGNPRKALRYLPLGRRNVGRPRTTWCSMVEKEDAF